MVITLDSGHYGKYNQSPVIKNFYESEFNWKMTNKLAKYLKQYGITVKLTRSELNRDKALYERGLMAKVLICLYQFMQMLVMIQQLITQL